MSILASQVRSLAHAYVRGGSKTNRRLQVGRMLKFVAFVEDAERLHNLHEIGHRHIINFWKGHRDLAPKTAHDYWLALCALWRLAGKSGKPPRPLSFSGADTGRGHRPTGQKSEAVLDIGLLPSLDDISQILKGRRHAQALTVEAVACATGVAPDAIAAIEAGRDSSRYSDIAALFTFYATLPCRSQS
jgi:DNA-binding transcriptional regulator YdaS (Cro superfamily)